MRLPKESALNARKSFTVAAAQFTNLPKRALLSSELLSAALLALRPVMLGGRFNMDTEGWQEVARQRPSARCFRKRFKKEKSYQRIISERALKTQSGQIGQICSASQN